MISVAFSNGQSQPLARLPAQETADFKAAAGIRALVIDAARTRAAGATGEGDAGAAALLVQLGAQPNEFFRLLVPARLFLEQDRQTGPAQPLHIKVVQPHVTLGFPRRQATGAAALAIVGSGHGIILLRAARTDEQFPLPLTDRPKPAAASGPCRSISRTNRAAI